MTPAQNESGMALMLALLFVVLLTVIVVEFCYETQVDASLAQHQIEEQQAYWAAKSAVARGISLLANDIDQAYEDGGGTTTSTGGTTRGSTTKGGTSQKSGTFGASSSRTNTRTSTNTNSGSGTASEGAMYDSLQDLWADGIPYEAINDAVMQCIIDDEYGKINLNALVMSDTQGSTTEDSTESVGDDVQVQQEKNEFVAEVLRALFQARGTENDSVDALVDSIIDWIDQDDDQSNEGAEYDYYESLELPFGCKNGPMNSVEELFMIRGMTPEIFWGDPEKDQLPLTELLTVHGHPQGKININTAEWETLDAVGIVINRDALADEVIPEREDNPYMDESDIQSRLGLESTEHRGSTRREGTTVKANTPVDSGLSEETSTQQTGQALEDLMQQPFVAESSVFRVRGHGMAGASTVRIEAYVWRNSGASGEMTEPFRIIDWRLIR